MRYSILFLIAITFCYCTSEEVSLDSATHLGQHYFPLEVGQYRVYDVNEIRYSLISTDTLTYQLKEKVSEELATENNFRSFEMQRSTRSNESEAWKLDSLWIAKINNTAALMVENNITLQKLSFPIQHKLRWDGNAHNSSEEDFYEIDISVQDTLINSQQYSNLLKVVQSDNEKDILSQDDRFEVYALDIGLLIKKSLRINFCVSDCSSIDQIVSGRDYIQTIVEFGTEE